MINFAIDDLSAILSNKQYLSNYNINHIDTHGVDDSSKYGPTIFCSANFVDYTTPTNFTIRLRDKCPGISNIVIIDVDIPLVIYNDKNRNSWDTILNDNTRKLVVSQLNKRKDLHSHIRLVNGHPVSVSSMFYDLTDYEASGKSVLERNILNGLCHLILDPELNILDSLLNLCIEGSTSEKMYILKTG